MKLLLLICFQATDLAQYLQRLEGARLKVIKM